MPRPVKWSRDVHSICERAARSSTETWSRADIEHLFGVGPSSAQALMKAIGGLEVVGGTHFVSRSSLLDFLDEVIAAPSVETGMQARLLQADAPPRRKALRVSLAPDLRSVMLRDLPDNIRISAARLEISAPTAVAMLESLALLAQAMQNDLAQIAMVLEPPARPELRDDDLKSWLSGMRDRAATTP